MIDWEDAKNTQLHLGCGRHHLENWVNADGIAGPGIDCVLDAHQDLHGIPAGALTWVYTSHVLEHFYVDKVPGILKHLHRALRPGGKLTIATTDLIGIFTNCFLNARYVSGKWESPLFGQTLSTDHPFDAHRDCFTYGKLEVMLRAAGFAEVRRWSPDDAGYEAIRALNDYSSSAKLVSCYAEGIK